MTALRRPAVLSALLLLACAAELLAQPAAPTELSRVWRETLGPPSAPNVLLVLADDVGTDRVSAYGEHPDPGSTPVIDALAANGLLFRNAWSNPTCSPTRATILSGTYALRSGVGRVINYENGAYELDLQGPSLPRSLGPGYASALIGKWHLTTQDLTGPTHPLAFGFEHHAGPLSNVDDYDSYPLSVDGVVQPSLEYATTRQVDDALAAIASFGAQPWFVGVWFTAAHGPFHAPPAHLHGFDLPPFPADDLPLHHKAMVQAMDSELGRLLASLPPAVLARTFVIFVGDNGTPKAAVQPPADPAHAKATPYEGGLNVPLVVAGPALPRGAEVAGLVNTTDLFATVAELTGGDAAGAVDSLSLLPYFADPARASLRPWVYAENFGPNGTDPRAWVNWVRAIRDPAGFKLIQRHANGALEQEELYDLAADPHETSDLLQGALTPQAAAALDALRAALAGI